MANGKVMPKDPYFGSLKNGDTEFFLVDFLLKTNIGENCVLGVVPGYGKTTLTV